MPNYKLTYFNIRGRGEICRLTLAAAGQKFQDDRLDISDWTPDRKARSPWGFLPILEKDGKQISQTAAIVSYLAHQYGLAGSGAWEHGLVDSVVISSMDLYNSVEYTLMGRADDAMKEKFKNTLPATLRSMENLISQYGGHGHAVGNKLTTADIAIFSVYEHIEQGKGLPADSLAAEIGKYPKVKTVVDKVRANEKIQNYIKNRPASAM